MYISHMLFYNEQMNKLINNTTLLEVNGSALLSLKPIHTNSHPHNLSISETYYAYPSVSFSVFTVDVWQATSKFPV